MNAPAKLLDQLCVDLGRKCWINSSVGLDQFKRRATLDMLKTVGAERGVDVLVTTHNPALLDAMGTEMLPFITVANRDPATGHSVLTLLEDIAQLPKLLAQGPIGRLSSQGLIEKSIAAEQVASAQEELRFE